MTKICKRCQQEKNLAEYYQRRDGTVTESYCKECRRVIAKEDSKSKQRLQKWRDANPEKYSAQHQAAGARRAQRVKTQESYANHLRQQKKEHSRKNFVQCMLQRARQRAKRDKVLFSLTVHDVHIPTHCPVLGIKMELGTRSDYRNTYTLDRVDPTKGYTPDNTRVISMIANTMKSNASREELLTFARNIEAYLDFKI